MTRFSRLAPVLLLALALALAPACTGLRAGIRVGPDVARVLCESVGVLVGSAHDVNNVLVGAGSSSGADAINSAGDKAAGACAIFNVFDLVAQNIHERIEPLPGVSPPMLRDVTPGSPPVLGPP